MSSFTHREMKELLLQKLTMVDVVKRYTPRPIKNRRCRCRLHGGENPNMVLYQNSFYCFRCNQGGDLIKYVSTYFNITYTEAIRKIAEDFGLGIRKENGYRSSEPSDKYYSETKNSDQLREELRRNKGYAEDNYRFWLKFVVMNHDKIEKLRKDAAFSQQFHLALKLEGYLNYRLDMAEDLLNEYHTV